MNLVREPDAGNPPVRFDEREVETEHGMRTGAKKVLGVCHRLNELVSRLPTFIRPEAMVYQVNQVLRGWANYFCYGTYTSAHKIVHTHVCRRVRRWLRRKFEGRWAGISPISRKPSGA